MFYPQWIAGEDQYPKKTICYQNDFIEDMHRFREDDPDNDEVINQVPGWADPC
ncbi:phenolic acid decarboxylase [Pantoea vagans]|uniref:phenolic acid decarboxylase n=1 Tax=Pantoea vagans TaxID=470934 RepID=UPI00296EF756|nr:phenolic acid decarboxylase [Pantoea agglomerans]